MESTRPPKSNRKLQSEDDREEVTQKLFSVQSREVADREHDRLIQIMVILWLS